jgi:hypothetical protein
MKSPFLAAVLLVGSACHQPAPAPAPAPARPAAPKLVVQAGEPWKYGKLTDRYFVSVRDPRGKRTWRCEPTSPRDAHRCDGTRAWFSGPGTYAVEVTVPRGVAAMQTFYADGSELGFEVELSFMSDELHGPQRLSELHVMRLLPSIAGVSLERAWKPAADSYPAYRLVNRSPETLYGVGLFANYFGEIEQKAGGSWVPVRRGGFCGTVDSGKPLRPGEEAVSLEGYFIGEVKKLERGEYRYVLRYSVVSAGSGGGVPADVFAAGRTYTRASHLHVLAVPFEIPST